MTINEEILDKLARELSAAGRHSGRERTAEAAHQRAGREDVGGGVDRASRVQEA